MRACVLAWKALKLGEGAKGTVVSVVILSGVSIAGIVAWLQQYVSLSVLVGLLLALFFYGLCKASFNEVREATLNTSAAERQRDGLQDALQESQQERERLEAELHKAERERERLKTERQVQVAVDSQTQDSFGSVPAPQRLPANVASQLRFDNLSFQITDLVRGGNTILNRTFEHCTIHGPAVLFLQGATSLQRNIFVSADREAMLWGPCTKKAF